MNGCVYVLSNPSNRYYKIGFTTGEPETRAREMSRSSGVPESFEIEFYFSCADPDRVEQRIHKHLDQNRNNANREFFNVDLETIEQAFINQTEDIAGEFYYCNYKQDNGVIINTDAVAFYQQAIQNRKDAYRQENLEAEAKRAELLNKQQREAERNKFNERIASGLMAESIKVNKSNYPLDTVTAFIFVAAIIFSFYFSLFH